jgi:SNF2 family DNA or RNA helicase
MEMGTGKTRIGIEIIQEAIDNGATLIGIAAPLAVLYVWVENWWDWADYPVCFLNIHDTGSAGIRAAKKMARAGIPVICLINYDKAWRMGRRVEKRINKKSQQIVKKTVKFDSSLDDIGFDLFIADESTAIKTPGAKVSRYFRKRLAPRAKKRLVLTGSAYIKKPLDVWAQMQFALDPTPDKDSYFILPPTMELMRARYAIPHPQIRGAIKGYHNLDDLVAKLDKAAIMLKQSDVLDLQEPVHTKRYIILSPKNRKLYDKMTQDQYLELEELERSGQTVTAAHIFTVMLKQAQLASGFLVTDPELDTSTGKWTKRDVVYVGHDKDDEIIETLREREGEPTVIVTQFDAEEKSLIERIEKEFGFTPKVLNGSVKGSKARYELSRAASQDPAYIVKESVGCRGIDLRWATMTIWKSHSSRTENYDQMLKRNQRGGQTKLILYRHMIAKDTIDQKIFNSLNSDLDLASRIEDNWRRLFE